MKAQGSITVLSCAGLRRWVLFLDPFLQLRRLRQREKRSLTHLAWDRMRMWFHFLLIPEEAVLKRAEVLRRQVW